MERGGPGTGEVDGLRRVIGFWGGTAIVVGTVIGGGIFRTPASIASALPDPRWVLALWLGFGVVTLCGALTLAELASLLPRTGGTYVYLRAAYGDAAAFVFGWLYLLAATPSGMGALSVFFGELVLQLAGRRPDEAPPGFVPAVAIGTILLLSASNIAGVRFGAAVQKTFTVIKVSALLAIIAAAFALGKGDAGHYTQAAGEAGLAPLAAAAAFVMFTYNGWVYIGLVAGELDAPEKRLKRIIFAGTATVIALYLGANAAYFYMMPVGAMPEKVVAREVMAGIFGPAGGTLILAAIMASVFGALNGVILTKTRVPYALSRDGLGFSFIGRAHARFATPYVSIAIQAAVAIALVLLLRDPLKPGRLFDRITKYFVLVEWAALVFAIAAVFVLRRRMADAPRPYRTPGYPVVPLLFIVPTVAALAATAAQSCAKGEYELLAGLGIAAAGFPVYWIWRRVKMSVRFGRSS